LLYGDGFSTGRHGVDIHPVEICIKTQLLWHREWHLAETASVLQVISCIITGAQHVRASNGHPQLQTAEAVRLYRTTAGVGVSV